MRIAGAAGGLPADWGAAVGVTLLITLPADWQQEGFEVGGGLIIYVEQSPTAWGYYSATILALNNQTATVRVDAIIAQSMLPPALEREEDSIIFLQDFASADVAAIVVRDGEENAFSSALNTNSIFAPHPDRALILSSSTPGTFAVSTPLWASNAAITIQRRSVTLRVGHFWPLQDGANLAAQAPQSLYPNRLWLLFGSSEQHFVKIQLSTSQLNLYENNQPITQTVTVSGNNITGYTPSAPGAVAAFVALHNRTLAHQSAAADVQALLQSKPSGTFTFIPPSPQAVGVGVFYSPTAGWGVRVSPPSQLATPSPLVYVGFVTGSPPFASRNNGFVYPYDALTLRVSIDPSLQQILRVRCDIINLVTNELIDSYTTDEARSLLHYHAHNNPPADVNVILLETTDKHVKVISPTEWWIRLYHRRFPAAAGTIAVRLRAIVETTTGIYVTQNEPFDVSERPLTAAGTWTETATHVNFSVFIDTPLPPDILIPEEVVHIVYRAAVFENDISDTPVSQSNNEFPNPAYTTSPLILPLSDTTFSVQIPKPTAAGRYKAYVRVSAYVYEPDDIEDYGIFFVASFAEVYEFVVPPPLPPAPTGTSECVVCIPRLAGEAITLLFPEPPRDAEHNLLPHTPAGDWYKYQLPASGGVCFDKYHCGFYETSEIPAQYVDIIAHFDNRVWGRVVQGASLTRVVGALERISDDVEVERYVARSYDEDDILRAFKAKYKLTVLIRTACELFAVELLKFAKRLDVKARQGLLREVYDVVVESFEVETRYSVLRVTMTLRERYYRKEYRY